MRSRVFGTCQLLGCCLSAIFLWGTIPVHGASSTAAPTTPTWNSQSAAHYLDDREVWWQNWPRAQKENGTLCISCHTVVPYAMVRPGMKKDLGESAISAPEKVMMDSVEKRVAQWSKMAPFYSDEKYGEGKAVTSRATEAVLNAIVLASYDARQGHLRPITRTAFENAWALQQTSGDLAGGWMWQDFHLGPWESAESGYQGAALFRIEALNAPDGYASEPEVRKHLDAERVYLQKNYAAQPVINQLYILWATAKDPNLLSGDERQTLLAAIKAQQQEDGGWRTATIDKRERADHSPEPSESDGYATGLVVLALEESGASATDAPLQRGLNWLREHQQKDGAWLAASINKQRDPKSDPALFMTDAATAYAVMALQEAR